ncbi:protein kinase domain-containing protein [Bythopirellula polymerisocia]|uniref:Tubulin-like protein n=1 Tax=Bythopirellula polymerisocia TaxID=2528003 RepID=A0A5C6CCR2_9BACT|nr:tubulin-like doman-containing protein [Bythopirellula polymerisocia]TWU21902.1 Tubulin-like protein [Bythopirellula polymerisocia]
MSSTIAESIELPSGYSIIDRLGAGGYGEVWKAIAPGGVEKAIKVVFGHCDEGMAERELKSLERIKSVRHPFVLSVERFEIVNHRLVIVTELADMSLNDSFQSYLSEGHQGIPREQLIAYLWDAADALDCLVDQHSLQHLDIKPENLLVVGDHVKVADFGLVKELASKTINSMMGGMTPLYSAPEIYDDNPSAFSDQYSLAIVYQHMLTGSLPFPGRTPAQLAKQHTLSEPNLCQLSEADQRIVGRALEKQPTARYSSCRDFVSALRSAGKSNNVGSTNSSNHESSQHSSSVASEDTKSLDLSETKHAEVSVVTAATQVLSDITKTCDLSEKTVERPQLKALPKRFPRVESTIEDIETPDCDRTTSTESCPTLYIGVGGMGITMLRAIRSRANSHDPETESSRAWLAIDTERDALKSTSDGECHDSLSSDEKLHIPLRRPNEYREESQDLLKWVSRRWLYNIPRSLQTRGFRPLGRIAIVDHAEAVFSALQNRLHWLAMNDHGSENKPRPIRVVLLVGMSGGTGGGTVIDLAQGVRSVCQEFSQEVVIHGVLGTTFHNGSAESLAAANMYSLLTEINHSQLRGNCGECPPPGLASRFELPQRPFDEIYTVAIPMRGDREVYDLTLQSMAEYLLLEADGSIAPVVDALRSVREDSADQTSLRTFSCVNVDHLANSFRSIHQQQLTAAITASWQEQIADESDGDAKCFEQYANSQFAHAVLAHFPRIVARSNDAIEDSESSTQNKIRTDNIQSIAKAFLQFFECNGLPHHADQAMIDSADVASASSQIIDKFCLLFQSKSVPEHELSQELAKLLAQHVCEMTESISIANPPFLAESALTLLEGSPLKCGYRRRTMLITPSDQHDSALLEAFKESCPTLANFQTAVADTYLIREGSELQALYLGARLAETYPDIDEAGGRLHTRNDISWEDLRGV